MTCDRVLTLIEEYCDGELARSEHGLVAAHVAGCAGCAAAVEAMERESALYAQYERGFEPGPELWAGVLERIEPDARPRRSAEADGFSWLERVAAWLTPGRLAPIAAACALAILASVAYVALRQPDQPAVQRADVPSSPEGHVGTGVDVATETGGTKSPAKPAAPPAPGPTKPRALNPPPVAPKPPTLPEPVVAAERQYIRTIAALNNDVAKSGGSVDEKLRKPLFELDKNIVAAREAVQKNPNDTEALLNMLSAYDQKVEVLQSLARFQVARNR